MRKRIAAARRFAGDDSGATMLEYALMAAFVAAACVAAVTAFGQVVNAQFTIVIGNA